MTAWARPLDSNANVSLEYRDNIAILVDGKAKFPGHSRFDWVRNHNLPKANTKSTYFLDQSYSGRIYSRLDPVPVM